MFKHLNRCDDRAPYALYGAEPSVAQSATHSQLEPALSARSTSNGNGRRALLAGAQSSRDGRHTSWRYAPNPPRTFYATRSLHASFAIFCQTQPLSVANLRELISAILFQNKKATCTLKPRAGLRAKTFGSRGASTTLARVLRKRSPTRRSNNAPKHAQARKFSGNKSRDATIRLCSASAPHS